MEVFCFNLETYNLECISWIHKTQTVFNNAGAHLNLKATQFLCRQKCVTIKLFQI